MRTKTGYAENADAAVLVAVAQLRVIRLIRARNLVSTESVN